MNRKSISESVRKQVAGRQLYKCANNNMQIANYTCPLWNSKNNGSFDESGYEIDHIIEHTITKDNSVNNLQALCKSCHTVKTKRFNSMYLKDEIIYVKCVGNIDGCNIRDNPTSNSKIVGIIHKNEIICVYRDVVDNYYKLYNNIGYVICSISSDNYVLKWKIIK